MADDTNTPKETIKQKVARLELEAKLAKLEKEAANRAKAPIADRAKEAVVSGAEKTTGAVKKATSYVKEKTGVGANLVKNPVTGRMEAPPNFLEKGIVGLADITAALANKAKTALVGQSVEESIRSRMTPEQQTRDVVDRVKRATELKRAVAEQAKTQRLNTPSPNLDVGPDKKVVVGPRGQQAVVPKSTPNIAVLEPLESRISSYTDRLHNFIKNESPAFTTGMRKTYPSAILNASRNRIAQMGGSQFAEDFLIAGLNKSGMFTADEVPAVAARLKNRLETRKLLTDSLLFDDIDRPKTMLSGGAPKPIDGGSSKFTTIQDDFGDEVRVTPEGRTTWAGQPPEPTLDERLAKFKGKKADTLKAAELAREVEAEAARRAVEPYGGNRPPNANSPSSGLILRNEIETRKRALEAAKEAVKQEAELAKQKTRARIEGANNASEQAFLNRQQVEATARQNAGLEEVWDLRTPRELAMPMATAAQGITGDTPTGVTRMDRLRNIASANQASPERYALDRWLYSRAALNQVPTTGLPPRGTTLPSPRSGLPPVGNALGRGGMAFGMIPDVMMAHRAGTAGAGTSSQGDFLYPHEMQTFDGQAYSTDTLDYVAAMHPDNADKYPQISHSQRYKFNPQWYKGGYEEARVLDVENFVRQTGFEAKPMMGSQPISPELLNLFRYAQ
jgi:hypothetical protein